MRRTPLAVLALLLALGACRPRAGGRLQGYIEGEFVYVAAPSAGALSKLEVSKGAAVESGAPLFALDAMPEQAARDQAQQELQRASAALEDARKGKRPTEIQALTATLDEARAALARSQSEAARQEKLWEKPGATSQQDLDNARALREQDRQRVLGLTADLETARLGSREDQVAAAESEVRAARAALDRAEWQLEQKHPRSPRTGLVFDTLYREGDWVGAGLPVVVLLPPGNVKLRTFVAEERVGALQLGDTLQVFVDGVHGSCSGRVSYIAPRAEYTPPVVYSRENRLKFVFLVEAVFEPDVARTLHPGQPVEVEFAGPHP